MPAAPKPQRTKLLAAGKPTAEAESELAALCAAEKPKRVRQTRTMLRFIELHGGMLATLERCPHDERDAIDVGAMFQLQLLALRLARVTATVLAELRETGGEERVLILLLLAAAAQGSYITDDAEPAWPYYVGSIAVFSRTADGVLLPDPKITPGAVRTSSVRELCARDFRTGNFRKTSRQTKRAVYREYGITPHKGICRNGCEVDHLLAIEDGGGDVIANLWIQPAFPRPGFHEKDLTENWVRRRVCSGGAGIEALQRQMILDWTVLYREMVAR